MAMMKPGRIAGIDKPISRLIQGINVAKNKGREAGFALLDDCLTRGCNVFDTARVYGDADRFLGEWIAARGNRDEVVILGKGAHHSGERQRVTPDDIRADLDKSLSELGVDRIDLFILHRDDPTQPVGPIVEMLNALADDGKIGAFGGSNWRHARIAEANAYAAAHSLTPFAVTNPNYTLAVQVEEPWDNCVSIGGPDGASERVGYRADRMPVFCWSSLAAGFFSGRLTRANAEDMAATMPMVARCYYSEDNFRRLDRAWELAARHGATVPQIALAFLFHQGLDLYALVGCATGDEMQANVDALHLALTPVEVAYLDLLSDDSG